VAKIEANKISACEFGEELEILIVKKKFKKTLFFLHQIFIACRRARRLKVFKFSFSPDSLSHKLRAAKSVT